MADEPRSTGGKTAVGARAFPHPSSISSGLQQVAKAVEQDARDEGSGARSSAPLGACFLPWHPVSYPSVSYRPGQIALTGGGEGGTKQTDALIGAWPHLALLGSSAQGQQGLGRRPARGLDDALPLERSSRKGTTAPVLAPSSAQFRPALASSALQPGCCARSHR